MLRGGLTSMVTGKGDLVRHRGEQRTALYTRSTHTGIGKSGSVEAISAKGNSERI
jgi:hypothetical protein